MADWLHCSSHVQQLFFPTATKIRLLGFFFIYCNMYQRHKRVGRFCSVVQPSCLISADVTDSLLDQLDLVLTLQEKILLLLLGLTLPLAFYLTLKLVHVTVLLNSPEGLSREDKRGLEINSPEKTLNLNDLHASFRFLLMQSEHPAKTDTFWSVGLRALVWLLRRRVLLNASHLSQMHMQIICISRKKKKKQ